MNKKIAFRKLVAIFLLLICTLTVSVACSTTKTSNQTKAKDELAKLRATKLYAEKEVEIGDNNFSPQFLEVEPNTLVIWTNKGIAIHDVMDDKTATNIMDSENLKSGDIYFAVFTEEGVYGYHCHFHGGPKFGQYGTVTVKAKE